MSTSTLPLQEVQAEQLINNLSQLVTYSIGRRADNTICIPNGKISGKHALLIQCTTDSFVVIDLDSKNGTFVNGVRVTRKVIGKKDCIKLADTDYTIDALLELLPSQVPESHKSKQPESADNRNLSLATSASVDTNLLNFTQEFAELQKVFEQYPKLRKDCRNREKMIRTGSVILSSIVGISAVLSTGGTALPFLHVMSGAGLSMLIPTLCSTLLSTDEKLEIIDKEYRERYRCPNPSCRDPFGMREWELLAQQKSCRRCQAVWVK